MAYTGIWQIGTEWQTYCVQTVFSNLNTTWGPAPAAKFVGQPVPLKQACREPWSGQPWCEQLECALV